MSQTKLHILLVILVFCADVSFGQIAYQSPHVKNGETIQFHLPEGFYEMDDVSSRIGHLFSTQKNLSYEDENIDSLILGIPILAVMHFPVWDKPIEILHEQLIKKFNDNIDGATIFESPTITSINGESVLFAGGKGEVDENNLAAIYVGAITFGDYSIIMTYGASDRVKDVMSYEEFKKILSNWKVVPTENENDALFLNKGEEIVRYDEQVSPPAPPPVPVKPKKDFVKELLVDFYRNDLFETNLSPLDFLPDVTGNWMLPMEGNSHLLFELVYKRDKGAIKIFSGGRAENYPTEEEMSKTVQQVMNCSEKLGLTFEQTFYGEQIKYDEYLVSNGGTIVSVYTSVVNGELIFYVADGGENPEAAFSTEVHNCLVTLWITTFEGDFFEEDE